MTNLDIWLLAIGLAMDCFAVSIASGIIMKSIRLRPMLSMAFAFGFFQALMPLLGWIGASFFSHLIEDWDHWIAFAILVFLGGRMVCESFKDEECRHEFDPTNLNVLLTLAVATSIDALAVGISFVAEEIGLQIDPVRIVIRLAGNRGLFPEIGDSVVNRDRKP